MEADGVPRLWILLIVSDLRCVRWLREQLAVSPELDALLACSLASAARLLEKRQFDVIVTDLTLPDASGLPVVQRVRACAPRLPLIVLSHDTHDLSVHALEAGAQDYLPLSGGHRTLQESVQYAIERKHAESGPRLLTPPISSREIVSVGGGRWGHEVRGGGEPGALLRSALGALPSGRVLVTVAASWLTTPDALLGLPPAAVSRVVLGVDAPAAIASSPGAVGRLARFRAAGGLVFASGAGERSLCELVSMPLDGLIPSPAVCVLAQERRGAALVRALVTLGAECDWQVLGTGEALRFLGCDLIRREEWSRLQ